MNNTAKQLKSLNDYPRTDLGIHASTVDLNHFPQIKKQIFHEKELITQNSYGFMRMELDKYAISFLEYIKQYPSTPALEIGCAYGQCTKKVLEQGNRLSVCDLSEEHLIDISRNIPKNQLDNLFLNHASFPDETNFPNETFSAVWAGRLLHFLSDEELDYGVSKVHDWLVKGGKFYGTVASIYHSTWNSFFDTYQKSVKNGEKYPGTTHTSMLPDDIKEFVQDNDFYIFDEPDLRNILTRNGFNVEEIGFWDFDQDLNENRNNKGHLGFVATKI